MIYDMIDTQALDEDLSIYRLYYILYISICYVLSVLRCCHKQTAKRHIPIRIRNIQVQLK